MCQEISFCVKSFTVKSCWACHCTINCFSFPCFKKTCGCKNYWLMNCRHNSLRDFQMFSWRAREETAYMYWCYLGKKLLKLHMQCLQPVSNIAEKPSSPPDSSSRYNSLVKFTSTQPVDLVIEIIGEFYYPWKQTGQIKTNLFREQL